MNCLLVMLCKNLVFWTDLPWLDIFSTSARESALKGCIYRTPCSGWCGSCSSEHAWNILVLDLPFPVSIIVRQLTAALYCIVPSIRKHIEASALCVSLADIDNIFPIEYARPRACASMWPLKTLFYKGRSRGFEWWLVDTCNWYADRSGKQGPGKMHFHCH